MTKNKKVKPDNCPKKQKTEEGPQSAAVPKAERFHIALPVPPKSALDKTAAVPEEIVIKPVAVEPSQVPPLPAPVKTRCIITLKHAFWSGAEYVVLSAAPGCELPGSLVTGQEVDVLFSPPDSAGPTG